MPKSRRINRIIPVALCLLFLYAPIMVMAFFSFNKAKSLTHYTGFSGKWYVEMFANQQLMNAIFVSVSVALIATMVATVLGTISAVALARSKRVVKTLVQQVNNLPIMNPEIVTAIALMIFFSFISFNKGYMTMLMAHIAFCTPYVITNVYPKVKALDPNLAEAAMDLGATPGETLWRVILPEIKPGIIAGALIAFTMSFDDFIISYFVSGNGVENISIVVYNMSKRMNPSIYALSTAILVVIMIVVLIGTFGPYLIYKKYGRMPRFITRLGYIGLALVVIIAGFTSFRANTATQVLKVFNAGEYADMNVIAAFEQEYNCRVIYETFDSNESMYTKLLGGNNYDILVPSDYMIARLMKEKRIVKIDWDLIPNVKSIDPTVMNQEFDKNNEYWVPYFCGNVGIVYDKRQVSKEDLKDGWNILMNPKFKGDIYMYDSERDSIMVALKALGYSMNTTKKKEIKAAYNWLVKQRNTMNPTYAGDDSIDAMKSGNKALCVMYSGDACAVMEENDNLGFFMPEEGTNYWFDGFVITKECENQTLANEFINYMISDENAYLHTVEVGYLTPNLVAAEKARKNDFVNNIGYELRIDKNDECFGYQDNETKSLFSQYWTKVKAK